MNDGMGMRYVLHVSENPLLSLPKQPHFLNPLKYYRESLYAT